MGSSPVLLHWLRVDLEVMAMNGYSALPTAPELEPHHQMWGSWVFTIGTMSQFLKSDFEKLEFQTQAKPFHMALQTGCFQGLFKN